MSDYLFAGALMVGVALLTAWLEHRNQETIAGAARVLDGDTLVLAGQKIRLIGIDAPEYDQTCQRGGTNWPCGKAATQRLRKMVGAGDISCVTDGRDKYNRALGHCSLGQLDINAAMVEQGMAVAYGDYEKQEAAAQSHEAGLWAGTFDQPSQWRTQKGFEVETDAQHGGSLLSKLGRRVDELISWTGQKLGLSHE